LSDMGCKRDAIVDMPIWQCLAVRVQKSEQAHAKVRQILWEICVIILIV